MPSTPAWKDNDTMNMRLFHRLGFWTIFAFVAVVLTNALLTPMNAQTTYISTRNKELVQKAFDAWRSGTGGPFDLLDLEATWTITGNSLVARQYKNRQEFLDVVIKPFNARLSKPLVPTIRRLYCDGNTVIALFDAEATVIDGQPRRNTYAWFMTMKDGKIVDVTAFFDAIVFNDLWKRVEPRPSR